MAIRNRHYHPEQRNCLRPLAGRICFYGIRFFAKEAQNYWNIVWEELTTVASLVLNRRPTNQADR